MFFNLLGFLKKKSQNTLFEEFLATPLEGVKQMRIELSALARDFECPKHSSNLNNFLVLF